MNKLQRSGLHFTLFLVLLLPLLFQPLYAKTLVRVGAYEFPPYVQFENDHAKGFTAELITLLNQIQQEYHFELVMTTAVRRHQDFQQGLFDALFFEDINWGWQQRNIALQQSAAFARDDEVFIALKDHALTQRWFDDLSDKTIAGILGYHYRIADYHTAPELLASQYGMIVVTDHHASIDLVLKERVETAIVTRSFIFQYLNAYPYYRDSLLISERIDQSYQHQLLLAPTHPLDIKMLAMWVEQLLQQASFKETLAAHGLQLLPDSSAY